jgi:hypothetical protein
MHEVAIFQAVDITNIVENRVVQPIYAANLETTSCIVKNADKNRHDYESESHVTTSTALTSLECGKEESYATIAIVDLLPRHLVPLAASGFILYKQLQSK